MYPKARHEVPPPPPPPPPILVTIIIVNYSWNYYCNSRKYYYNSWNYYDRWIIIIIIGEIITTVGIIIVRIQIIIIIIVGIMTILGLGQYCSWLTADVPAPHLISVGRSWDWHWLMLNCRISRVLGLHRGWQDLLTPWRIQHSGSRERDQRVNIKQTKTQWVLERRSQTWLL